MLAFVLCFVNFIFLYFSYLSIFYFFYYVASLFINKPSLQRTFGMTDPPMSEEQKRRLEETIGTDFNETSKSKNSSPSEGRGRATTAPHMLSSSLNDLQFDRDGNTVSGNSQKRGGLTTTGGSRKHKVTGGGGFTRGALPKTLPIQALTKAGLVTSLTYSKVIGFYLHLSPYCALKMKLITSPLKY